VDTSDDPDPVSAAMRHVRRADFLPTQLRERAEEDVPFPIGHGQTNSQPFTVATMLRLLDLHPGQRVLDVGAGSGWTTALLAYVVGEAGQVIGVERIAALMPRAREALARYDRFGVAEIREADPGVLGAPADAPFDRILVSAMADHRPHALQDQLADRGILVVPVAGTMERVRRDGDRFAVTEHGEFVFVPLVEYS
jgi:protein-L-isoaspartate(D-aspartate) O-methyltransferase